MAIYDKTSDHKVPHTWCHVCLKGTPIGSDRDICYSHNGPRNEKHDMTHTEQEAFDTSELDRIISEREFIKDDKHKTQWSLLDWSFINGIVKVLTFGALKYSRDNWKNCDDRHRYEDAAMRHMISYLNGEKMDPETLESHLSHVGCNLMFLDYLDKKETNEA